MILVLNIFYILIFWVFNILNIYILNTIIYFLWLMCIFSAVNHVLLYVKFYFYFKSDSWMNGAFNWDLYVRDHLGIVHKQIVYKQMCRLSAYESYSLKWRFIAELWHIYMVSRAAGWSVITSFNNTTSRTVTYVHFLSPWIILYPMHLIHHRTMI